MSGTLFVVATPIGNLEDITLRALRVLREADLIAAEDTRRTARLLAHYAISTPTTSFHRHNTRSRLPTLVARLERGDSVALVTDAGTPGVSDPGTELVQACVERNIVVDPIPGVSAPLAAAVASGFPLAPLTIFGFVPARAKDRKYWLERVQALSHTFSFFEAPHRILRTLLDASTILGDRPILIAREISKVHQEFIRGRTGDIVGQITDVRGEFTVVVGPNDPPSTALNMSNDQEIWAEFGRLNYKVVGGRRQLVVDLARKHGRSPKDVYAIIEKLKGSGV